MQQIQGSDLLNEQKKMISKRMKVIRYRIRNSTRYYPLNTTVKEARLIEYVRRPRK